MHQDKEVILILILMGESKGATCFLLMIHPFTRNSTLINCNFTHTHAYIYICIRICVYMDGHIELAHSHGFPHEDNQSLALGRRRLLSVERKLAGFRQQSSPASPHMIYECKAR